MKRDDPATYTPIQIFERERSKMVRDKTIQRFLHYCKFISLMALSFFVGLGSLVGGCGAFGLPGNNPLWLILFIPIGLAIAVGICAAWVTWVDWNDNKH